MLGSIRLGQLLAPFVEVEFAVLELLVAESVREHFALAAVHVAALFDALFAALFAALFVALLATLLQGQAFLLLPPLLCPLYPCLYLALVLM